MGGSEHTRKDLEHLWKARVENIKLHLDFAAQYLREVGDDQRAGRMAPTDSDARENAIRAYTEALTKFVKVSKIYQELVMHGRVPDEEQSLDQQTMSAGLSDYR